MTLTDVEGRGVGRRGAGRGPAAALGAALVLGLAATLAAPAAGQQEDPTPHSEARLVTEHAAIAPGEPFTVGLHIT
ncbi:MAG: hypothetical protein P8177_12965, partial [Gemmatimonadota bacterium]